MYLPEKYKNSIKKILNEEFNEYEKALEMPRTYGIRINSLKCDNYDKLISDFNIRCNDKIPWTDNGFYYDEKYRPGKEALYHAGLYYMQEPSAMSPACFLPVEPGDRVLDMCAAPGGKTTELVSKLKNKGLLVANDISASRCKALIKNLEVWGSKNILVTSEDCDVLEKKFTMFFDKILLDAPCSGEGMFRKETKMINAWQEHGPEFFSPIQKQLLKNAINMLKPNGYLVYSTCTFSTEEDEENLKWVIENFSDMEIVELPYVDGFMKGNPHLVDSNEESISNSVKLFPHKLKGEGHFVSLLHKKLKNIENEETKKIDITENKIHIKKHLSQIKDKNISEEAREFLSNMNIYVNDDETIVSRTDNLYIQKKYLKQINGIRILRNGLLLGTMKKKRFEPSQAFAMTIKKEEYPNTLILNKDDERVLKYLKGETIEVFDNEKLSKGYVLIFLEDYPLGWGKLNNGVIKNKYLQGWRYNS